MSQAIQLPPESLEHTTTFAPNVPAVNAVTTRTMPAKAAVFYLETSREAEEALHPKLSPISELVRRFEADDGRKAELESARKWLAEELKPAEGVDLRTLRLRRGMSQQRLADAIHASQSRISLIEGGTVDIQVSTVLRIAEALGTTASEVFIAVLTKRGAAP